MVNDVIQADVEYLCHPTQHKCSKGVFVCRSLPRENGVDQMLSFWSNDVDQLIDRVVAANEISLTLRSGLIAGKANPERR